MRAQKEKAFSNRIIRGTAAAPAAPHATGAGNSPEILASSECFVEFGGDWTEALALREHDKDQILARAFAKQRVSLTRRRFIRKTGSLCC